MDVLLDQTLVFFREQAMNLHRLRDHECHLAQELHRAGIIVVFLERQISGERADRLAVHDDRSANKSRLVFSEPSISPVDRQAAGGRDHNGSAAPQHA